MTTPKFPRSALLACGLLLLAARPLRADVTVEDGSPDTFESALNDIIADGGGTIHVTTPIIIDTSRDWSGDLQSVTVTGDKTNGIFVVTGGTLTLSEMVLEDGVSTNGGAIYISEGAKAVITDCLFDGNVAVGTNGLAGAAGGDGGSSGDSGARGTPGDNARGGAIYNLGDLTVITSQFVTNTATGGDGGNGGNGGNGSLRGGNGASAGGGGVALGGAIYSAGTLDVSGSTFQNNAVSGGDGGDGGTAGSGSFSGVPGNGAPGGLGAGAGIYTEPGTDNTITACTFSGNTAAGGSSGSGTRKFAGGAPTGASGVGAGVANAGTLDLANSTFFGNTARGGNGGDGGKGGSGGSGIGGGIYNTGTVFVAFCTFSGGTAIGGSNGAVSGVTFGGSKMGKALGGNFANVAKKPLFVISNSIIATNFGGGSAGGTFTDGGLNLSSDKKVKLGKGSLKGVDPQLGSLAENGGPTMTMAIGSNSPAVDKVPTTPEFPEDQRGLPRPGGDGTLSDIGAYEFQPGTRPFIVFPFTTIPASTPTNGTQTVTQTNGGTVTITVEVIGNTPIVYRWFNITNTGATNQVLRTNSASTINSLKITNLNSNNAGAYFVVVSNISGIATSHLVFVTNANGVNIDVPPTSQTVTLGSSATFFAHATGSPTLVYQWQHNGTNTGVLATNITIPNVQMSDLGTYTVVVTNAFSSNSASAVLSMFAQIITQPADQTVPVGSNATFSVNVVGSTPLTYYWRFNGSTLVKVDGPTAATNSSFIIPSAQTNNAGSYDVIVSNSFNVVTSLPAKLTVTPPPPLAGSASFTAEVAPSAVAPPFLARAELGGENFRLSYPTELGATYVIEARESLADPGWTPVLTNPGTGDWITNELPATSSSRFFRVRMR